MTPTNDQIEWWRREGDQHLNRAEILGREADYAGCVYSCHQAAEFYLKLLHMHKEAEAAPKSHGLAHLAEAMGCPSELMDGLRALSQVYFSRYPDSPRFVPSERYAEQDATRALRTAQAVRAWVLGELGHQ